MIGNNSKKHIKQKLIITIILIISFMISAMSAYAVENNVSIVLSQTKVQLGTSFKLTLTVSDNIDIKDVSLLGADNFDIIGSNQSTSTQNINGQTTAKKIYYVTLMPKKVGEFALTGIVKYNNGEEERKTVNVTITEQDNTPISGKEDIFVETKITKENCYFGERLVLTYDLYTNKNLESYGFVDTVSLDGFITEETPQNQLQANYVQIDGVQYIKYEAKKIIITPTEAKTYAIPAYKFFVNIQATSFFASPETEYVTTKPLNITVNSLPTYNQPKDFSGLVGTVNIEAKYDKDTIPYGEPITLNIEMSGTANLDALDELYPTENSQFNIYTTPKDTQDIVNGNTIETSKAYEIIIIPKTTGEVTFTQQNISYFNTKTNQYENIAIPGQNIKVTGDVSNATTQPISSQNQSQKTQSVSINQVIYSSIAKDDVVLHFNKLFLYIMLVVLIIGLAGLVWMYVKSNIIKESRNNQYKKALKKAIDLEQAYEVLCDCIWARYHIKIKSERKEVVKRVINDETIYKSIEALIDYYEHGKYYEEKSIKEIKDKIEKII